MNRPVAPPRLALQNLQTTLDALRAAAAGHAPELTFEPGSLAAALLDAWAWMRTRLDESVNGLPPSRQAALLDLFGAALLPAQGARVPLVFELAPDSAGDVTLAAGSAVAAKAAATLPALDGATPPAAESPVFATDSTVTLTPGRLVSLASLDPGRDAWAEHAHRLTQGFVAFQGLQPTAHELYLGHDSLFKLGGNDITLIVGWRLQRAASQPLVLRWDYHAQGGWVPLPHAADEDTTAGLTGSGQVTLRRLCGPDAGKARVMGIETHWIRARLLQPLSADPGLQLPVVNDLSVRVRYAKQALLPEAAFADTRPVDLSKDFLPFGARPDAAGCFYIGSSEVFGRPRARVAIDIRLRKPGVGSTGLALAWEYLGAQGWQTLTVETTNGDSPPQAFSFQASANTPHGGQVHFVNPDDWPRAKVGGVEQHWLRVRITGGDFGTGAVLGSNGAVTPESWAAPLVASLQLSFEVLTAPEPLQHAVTHNDFRFDDVSDAARWPDRSFAPFAPLADRAPSLVFGFDRPLPLGLGALFAAVPTEAAEAPEASNWQWEYQGANGWRELPVIDDTGGLRRSGLLRFIGQPDAVALPGPGGDLYRLRARLPRDVQPQPVAVAGLWLNAAWASHRRRHERLPLGRGDGSAGQRLQLPMAPVHEGESIEVEEWLGPGTAWTLALADVPDADRRVDTDAASGAVRAVWVRWRARDQLHDARPGERVYSIERASGVLRFGPHAPPAGRRIVASFTSGGGAAGNVEAGQVSMLQLAQPSVRSASNPLPARGGADAETLARALPRGARGLRHRGRAVAARDFEGLALDASPQVARVRCLPLAGPDGPGQRGHLALRLLPHGAEPRPEPGDELLRRVRDAVAAAACATARVRLLPPRWCQVSVHAVIVPRRASEAALVEDQARRALDALLHPSGWDFGEAVPLSRLAQRLESLAGVAHVRQLVLLADGVLAGDQAQPAPDALPCAGTHELVLAGGGAA